MSTTGRKKLVSLIIVRWLCFCRPLNKSSSIDSLEYLFGFSNFFAEEVFSCVDTTTMANIMAGGQQQKDRYGFISVALSSQ